MIIFIVLLLKKESPLSDIIFISDVFIIRATYNETFNYTISISICAAKFEKLIIFFSQNIKFCDRSAQCV